METTVVQVRDVPSEVVDRLKERASARGQSFTAYLRELLAEEAATPPMEDVMAQIASREPINYNIDDIRGFIDEGRR